MYRDVDQRGIAEFIDSVDIRTMLGEERDRISESFDSQKVKNHLIVKPTRVDEIWMGGQQLSGSLVVSD
jgi:hypothetical protein